MANEKQILGTDFFPHYCLHSRNLNSRLSWMMNRIFCDTGVRRFKTEIKILLNENFFDRLQLCPKNGYFMYDFHLHVSKQKSPVTYFNFISWRHRLKYSVLEFMKHPHLLSSEILFRNPLLNKVCTIWSCSGVIRTVSWVSI